MIDVRGRPRTREVVKKPIYNEGAQLMAASESYPDELLYHAEHDWARIDGDEAVLGVTWHAQDALGELVHYEPPDVGATVGKDAPTARSSRSRQSRT